MAAKTLIAFLTGKLIAQDSDTTRLRLQMRASVRGYPELGSEDSNRCAEIQRLRIEEARDYVDLLRSALRKLGQVREALSHSRRLYRQTQSLNEVLSLLDLAGKKRYRIEVLEDRQLVDLNARLRDVLCEEQGRLSQLVRRVQNQGGISRDIVYGRTLEKNTEASALIAEMLGRLNRLAQTT
jgi:hypothetical protein